MTPSLVPLAQVLIRIQAGRSFQTLERPAAPGEMGVLKVSAVSWSEFRREENKAVPGSHQAEVHESVRGGDILISRANTRELVGAAVLVERDHPDRLLSDKTLRLVLDAQKVDPLYLVYALRSPAARAHIEGNATGTSHSMRNISQRVIEAIPVPLPPLSTQKQVACRLREQFDAFDQARAAAIEMQRELAALRTAAYREVFEGVVPVAVPVKLTHAPEGWVWTKLSELARLESGHTPSRSRPDWWDGDIPWISLTDIRSLDGRWAEDTSIHTNAAGIANSAARILPRGTVCFSRTASVGFVTLMERPMATSQDFANWVCGDDLNPEFLAHALIRSREALRELATGATHKTIYMPSLASFRVCLPSRSRQDHIVAELKERLAVVANLGSGLALQTSEVNALPSRLLAEAFP